ncbi:GNAT family N-acetyltransferase [Paracoccus aminovorans]|uniref:GNAT family N-acetyltransferase n=1 Tax=Paracoccus aminovorans TaxID=34004 RepID=UPI002B25E618|nr:GNAT family N-acetyltransferase [Paracoccus aminovorans]
MAEYAFRPVTRADLPLLADWLRLPEVARWWRGAEKQLAGIDEDLDLPEMRQVLALRDGVPLGYAQFYPAHRWGAPHFADLPAGTLAIDCFSGPAGFGQGGAWLRALSDRLLAETPVLVIDPEPDNLRAIRAYEKAGFAGEALRRSEDGTLARVMTRHR